jgi:hypothetical protein
MRRIVLVDNGSPSRKVTDVRVKMAAQLSPYLPANIPLLQAATPRRRQEARTPAWLAVDGVGLRETGKYFERMEMRRCRFGEDRVMVEALYRACLGY